MAFINPHVYEQYGKLKAYVRNMGNLPHLKDYLEDLTSLDNNRQFNNKVAKLNNNPLMDKLQKQIKMKMTKKK